MRCEWETILLAEFINFNPKESIAKGTMAKKIAMEHLRPFTKHITNFELCPFNGGSKFRNGDTLVARITPCLENGKTSQVSLLDENEIGFGSTEYIILRKIDGVSDHDFIYYLSIMPSFREIAIKSMVGSSGRQRVQQSVLSKTRLPLPPLPEQKRIAAILSALDDKIELNNRMNKNLEAQAQAIFKSWFVDFEPWDGVMPADWREGTLREICSYSQRRVSIKDIDVYKYFSTENMLPNKGGSIIASSLPSTVQTTACKKGDTLVSNIRPYFKKIVYCDLDGGCSSDVLCFEPISINYSLYLFQTLYADSFFHYMVAGSKGTKMPRGDKQQIMNYAGCIPSSEIINCFNAAIQPIRHMISTNKIQSKTLATIRDTLLPKLMNGEIQTKT